MTLLYRFLGRRREKETEKGRDRERERKIEKVRERKRERKEEGEDSVQHALFMNSKDRSARRQMS
jgi:hypothetical protein